MQEDSLARVTYEHAEDVRPMIEDAPF